MVFILIIYFGVFQEIKDLCMTAKTVVRQMNKSVFWRLIAFSLHDSSPKTLNFASSNENYY